MSDGNGRSEKILEEILAAVTTKPEYDDRTVVGLLNHIVAETNKHSGGTIAVHGEIALFMEVRPGLDKLTFGVLWGSQLHPIFNMDIHRRLPMGKYRLGLVLVPIP